MEKTLFKVYLTDDGCATDATCSCRREVFEVAESFARIISKKNAISDMFRMIFAFYKAHPEMVDKMHLEMPDGNDILKNLK